MFATLAGGLPRPPLDRPATGPDTPDVPQALLADRLVRAVLVAQAEAGLEPLVDGDQRHGEPLRATALGLAGVSEDPATGRLTLAGSSAPSWERPLFVDGWRATAAMTDRAVKQIVGGPYTLGHLVAGDPSRRGALTLAIAEALNAELRALAGAGCQLVQVDEPAAIRIGDSPVERALFVEANRRLLEGVDGTHLSLAVTGGNADAAGPATFFDPPYASYLFDLIKGPDNWRLIARAPGERGVICGAVPAGNESDIVKEVLVWAAHYAASTGGRGLQRVGLATAGSLVSLSWAVALGRLALLGRAARLADASPERLARELEPAAIRAAPRAPRQAGPARRAEGSPRRAEEPPDEVRDDR